MLPTHGMLADIVKANNEISRLKTTIDKLVKRDVRQREFIRHIELNGSSDWWIDFEDLSKNKSDDGEAP